MRRIRRKHSGATGERESGQLRIVPILAPLTLAAVVFISLWTFQINSVRRAQQDVYRTLEDTAQEQAHVLRICFSGRFEALETYAGMLDPLHLGTAEKQLRSMGRMVLATDFSRLLLVDAEGNSFSSQGLRSNVQNERFFSETMAGNNAIVKSDGDDVDPVAHFVLAVPMRVDDRVVGAVGGTYREQTFRETVLSEAFDGEGYILICDRDGDVIIGSNKRIRIPQNNVFAMLAGASIKERSLSACREGFKDGTSGVIGFHVDGASQYAAYMPIGVNDWMIMNVVAGGVVDKTVSEAMRSGFWLVAVVTLVALAFVAYVYLLSRRQRTRINDERMRLRLSDERFRIALAETSVAIWEYDFATRSIIYGDEGKAHEGDKRNRTNVPDSLVEEGYISPDSVEAYLAMYERLFAGEARAEGVFRVRDPQTHALRYMHVRYTSLFDETGKPYRAIGMSEDITEKQQAKLAYERELQVQQAMEPNMLVTALFDATEGIAVRKWFADAREAAALCDDRLETYMAYTARRIVNDADNPIDRVTAITPETLMQRYAAGQTELVSEYLRRMPDGSERFVEDESHLMLDPDSGHLMMFACLRDIDSERRQRDALVKLAESDAMTGLLHHEAALDRIRKALAERPDGVMHALFIADIDNFKVANDTFGHQTGDDIIKRVASLLRGAFRESDIVGRIGGDEFIVLMRNVGGLHAVRRKAQELIETLQLTCRQGEHVIELTVSAGACVCESAEETMETLYREADAALYESKAAGKNRYTLHSGEIRESGVSQRIGGVSSSVQLRTLLENMDGGVVMAEVGEEIRIVYASPSLYRLSEKPWETSETEGRNILSRVNPEDRPALEAAVFHAVRERERLHHTYRAKRGDGTYAWWQITGARLPEQPDGISRIICVISDVTELKRSEENLRIAQSIAAAARGNSKELYAAFERLVEVEYEYIALLDVETGVLSLLSVSAQTPRNAPEDGMPYAALHKNTVDAFIVPNEREDCRISFSLDVIKNVLRSMEVYTRIYAVQDASDAPCRKKWQFTYLDSTKKTMVLSRSDVTDTYLAEVDPVTGIFNRYKLSEQIRSMLTEHPDTKFAIIRADIDNFKVFNDIYGVDAGDRLLRSMADFLRELYYRYPMMLYGHVEADHFMCCMPVSLLDQAPKIQEIVEWLSEHNPEFSYTPRIGVYRIDDPTIDVSLMSDRAYLALKSIKGKYGRHVAYYSESMRRELLSEQEIVSQMHGALEGGQFDIYLQPQYDYVTGEMTGAETLARWRHPEKGVLTPGEFISVFEQNGFITRLDYYIWERACALLAKWKAAGEPLVPLSVNVSRVDIYDHGMLAVLEGLMRTYGLTPALLRLEITESAYMENPKQLIRVVEKLRAMGFTVEMDDFGSGYSSLNMLNDMQVDMLKLDMHFLSAGGDKSRRNDILNSIVRMMRWLRLPVIAEGVETAEQAEYLKSIGCIRMQGYYFGRPMPVATFERVKANARIAPVERLSRLDAAKEAAYHRASARAMELFNSAEQGALIVEYGDGNAEALRVNDRFFALSGKQNRAHSPWMLHVQELLDGESQRRVLAMAEEAIATDAEARCEITVAGADGDAKVFACAARLLMRLQNRSILFISVDRRN